MKKIITSLAIIAAVSAIVVGSTTSYFSDQEKSAGNTFQAGKLNLKVDNHCYYNGAECICAQSGEHAGECYWDIGGNGQFGDGEVSDDNRCFCTWSEKDLTDNDLFFDFTDIKPGDYGEDTVSLHVVNNDAWLCAQLENLANNDNGCEDPESQVDTTCGDNEGELADNLFFTVWQDNNCDNVLDSDEQILVDNQPASIGLWPLADSTTGEPINGDSTVCYGVKWEVPLSASNIIQSDSLTGDVVFTAVQARHMDDFKCSDLGSGGPECIQDSDCDDGNACTADVCVDGACQHNCQAGAVCDDGNPNTVRDQCQAIGNGCLCAGQLPACTSDADCDDGNVCTLDICQNYNCVHQFQNGASCDDGDPNTQNDTCMDGVCQGCINFYRDHDYDNYGVISDYQCLMAPNGEYHATQAGDCNDNDPHVNPGQNEICDNKDNDCDGATDEGLPTYTYYRDLDHDGYGDYNNSITTCDISAPAGYVANADDCDDTNNSVNPGALESCNNRDDDCDGQIDEWFPEQSQLCQPSGGGYSTYFCCNGHIHCGPCD